MSSNGGSNLGGSSAPGSPSIKGPLGLSLCAGDWWLPCSSWLAVAAGRGEKHGGVEAFSKLCSLAGHGGEGGVWLCC
jgi:hypothetical protein